MTSARILAAQNGFELHEGDLITVPAASYVLVVDGAIHSRIRLDGRVARTRAIGGSQVWAVDMTRSTGFHHLHVDPGHDYWFATQDAKLGLDGIEAMLAHLSGEGLGWSGQIMFSDGSYLRDPHVAYGWLDMHADRLVSTLAQLAKQPIHGTTMRSSISPNGQARIDKPQTLALFRRRGRELLYPAAGGPIEFAGNSYMPVKVVARHRADTIDTVANRRAAAVAADLARLIRDIEAELGPAERERVLAWRAVLNDVLNRSPIGRLAAGRRLAPRTPATTEELTDRRYGETYRAAASLASLSGWSATRERRTAYSYVNFSDEIYQAFVAYTVAAALGLHATHEVLGAGQPAFSSEDIDLYYDIEPPASVMRTWRSFSARRDAPRPDFLLHYKTDNSVVLGDAKYRNDGRRASESSRHDLMLYMQAYGLEHSVIFYPPRPAHTDLHSVHAQGYEIHEVPILPSADLGGFLRLQTLPLLDRVRRAPKWAG